MRRALAWSVLMGLCAIVSSWALVTMLFSALFGTGRKGRELALAFDRVGNVTAGGWGNETFSSRCWRRRDVPRYRRMVQLIDWAFLRFAGEENHCEKSWLSEELARESACTG